MVGSLGSTVRRLVLFNYVGSLRATVRRLALFKLFEGVATWTRHTTTRCHASHGHRTRAASLWLDWLGSLPLHLVCGRLQPGWAFGGNELVRLRQDSLTRIARNDTRPRRRVVPMAEQERLPMVGSLRSTVRRLALFNLVEGVATWARHTTARRHAV